MSFERSDPSSLFTENSAELTELTTIARQFIAQIPTTNNTNNTVLDTQPTLCVKTLNLFLDKLYTLCDDKAIVPDTDTMIQLLNSIFSTIQINADQLQFLRQLHEFVKNDLTVYNFRADEHFQEICQNESQNEAMNIYCGRMMITLNLLSGAMSINETITPMTEHSQKLVLASLQNYFNPRITQAFIGTQTLMPVETSKILKEVAIRHDRLITNYALIQISLNELIAQELEEKMQNQDSAEPYFFSAKKTGLAQSSERKKQLLDASDKCVTGIVRCADIILSSINEYACSLADNNPTKDHPLLLTIMSKALASLTRYKPEFYEISKPDSPRRNSFS